uniref:GG24010 n=1 Tax=Drosophila erecta TaxID=7220 RepID=B3NYW4_DROER
MPGGKGKDGEQPEETGQERRQEQEHQLPGFLEEMDLEMPQRPHSLGSNVIQESADYVLQLLHAYAAAFGL